MEVIKALVNRLCRFVPESVTYWRWADEMFMRAFMWSSGCTWECYGGGDCPRCVAVIAELRRKEGWE